MPIILDDILLPVNPTQAKKANPNGRFVPKFFHKDLTGTGGKTGRISNLVNPANPDTSYQPMIDIIQPMTSRDNDAEVRYLPTADVLENTLVDVIDKAHATSVDRRRHGVSQAELDANPYLYQMDIPAVESMIDLTALSDKDFGYRVWANIVPQVVILRNAKKVTDDGDTVSNNTIHIRYRTELYAVHASELEEVDEVVVDEDGNETTVSTTVPTMNRIGTVLDPVYQEPLLFSGLRSFAQIEWSYLPVDSIASMYSALHAYIQQNDPALANDPDPVHLDLDALVLDLEDNYNLYQRLCDQAYVMGNNVIADRTADLINQMYFALTWSADPDYIPSISGFTSLAFQLRLFEHYDVPLSGYSQLYTAISALPDEKIAQTLLKQNMQLALNGNLQRLASMKDTLAVPAPNTNHVLDPRYSIQQVEAITTAEPLAIVQAGAGTGKSTVILERLGYLQACGVNPANITVLSFTNAAADNISSKNDQVMSMTIAMMIHQIYSSNFPGQEMSSPETIVNSLDIYYGPQTQTNEFLAYFRALMLRLAHPDNATMTELSTFIERYTGPVIEVLNNIKQTCLELQIIMAYLLIDELNEPFVSPDYLIIDEVQDNSVFEFIFSLRYAIKHNTSLYLVGDASQTLYEFRSADPKALNALEGSGVFATYRLTTNYRSNQEILDFANIHLLDIEANQNAGIQLVSNTINPPSAESFQQKVQLKNHHVKNQAEFTDNLPSYLRDNAVISMLDEAIANNKQTIVLAGSRREVKAAQEALGEMYPHLTVANLTSERPFNSTVFSKFISRFWEEVTVVKPEDAAFVFTRQVMAHLYQLEKNHQKAQDSVTKSLSKWWLTNQGHITGWINQVNQGLLSVDAFFLHLRDNILDFEIKANMARLSLVNARNNERKAAHQAEKPLLLVSTIHGSKGLEFDNTIVVMRPSPSPSEETKRTYYVALTRAKEREIIITGSSVAHPRIVSDYESIVAALEERDKQINDQILDEAFEAERNGLIDQTIADLGVEVDFDDAFAATTILSDEEVEFYTQPRPDINQLIDVANMGTLAHLDDLAAHSGVIDEDTHEVISAPVATSAPVEVDRVVPQVRTPEFNQAPTNQVVSPAPVDPAQAFAFVNNQAQAASAPTPAQENNPSYNSEDVRNFFTNLPK